MSAARPSAGAEPRGARPYHWLAALPAVGMLAGIPFANRVEPYVLGLPFLLFWILAWVVVTSGVMGVIYALDQAHARRAGAPADGAPGGGRP
ncbi:MAG TPA: DUF3311 domain-containing protein [Longimicrobiales bacterium]|nr:DUF3311 domain-containing protein [Longimicrobiales bacterium]